MSKIEEVYDSIVTWKIGNEAGSKKVGIPLSEYMSLKGKILDIISDLKPVINQSLKKIITDRITTGACSTKSKLKLEKDLLDIPLETRTTETHTDLDTGKMKIEAISSKEPRSSEEIIELLKIDTANWKLSQYWNKEKTGYWLVSALVTKLKKEESDIFGFLDILKDYQFPIAVPVSKTPSKIKNLDHVCGILSLQDLHFGKAGNESMDGVVISLVDSMINQAYTSFHLDKVVVVIGGDCLNMDTFSGSTTNGTPVENSMSAQTSYIQAFEGLYLLLQLVKQHADEVKVVFIPGNHDRLSSFHLVHALSKSFQGIPDYTFYSEYK